MPSVAVKVMLNYISLTECNSGTTQKLPIWSYYYDLAKNVMTASDNIGTLLGRNMLR
jgi:hypothetical protein